MTFTADDLAKYYGVSKATFYRHLNKIKFTRTAVGDSYNEVDALNISKALGFSIPALTQNETTKFKASFK